MKRGSFFKNYPFHREDKRKEYEGRDWGMDERWEDIREVSKENPYSNRDLPCWNTDVKLLKLITLANRVSNAVFFPRIAVIPIP